jgi:hypothetical protein
MPTELMSLERMPRFEAPTPREIRYMLSTRLSIGTRIVAGCLVTGVMSGRAVTQDSSPALDAQLRTILKVTEVEWVGQTVTKPGTIVRLTKGNLLWETPVGQPMNCAATVREGTNSVPSSICRLTTKDTGSFLQEDQTLYVTHIRTNTPKDTVSLDLVNAAMDPTTGKPLPPTFKTSVNFVFSKGYLTQADAGQIADVISNLLPVDTGAAAPQQVAAAPQAAAPPPPPPPPAAVVAPAQIKLGMTEEQVESILGPPTKASSAGNNKTYVYHKQIVFRDGKVSAIE